MDNMIFILWVEEGEVIIFFSKLVGDKYIIY